MAKIGIIGGTGLDDPKLLKEKKEIDVNTPYGRPSSPLTVGSIKGVEVAIISRHGKKHDIMPSNVPFRANIWALKEQGCTHVVVSTACGSLREEIKPGHFVFIDQFIDRTTKRAQTFYEKEKVCHIGMAEPFCPYLRKLLSEVATELKIPHHNKGTIITIEGPRFSTRAESRLFQQWGADLINMSTVPEVVLAREAGMCYAAVAMSTDYDCWRESTETVSWEMVVNTVKQNAENVTRIFLALIPRIKKEDCACREAIKSAIM